jgi:hypothetical protein
MRVIVRVHRRWRVDALAGLVRTAIDDVAISTSPVLVHSSTRCSGRAHMTGKVSAKRRGCVR